MKTTSAEISQVPVINYYYSKLYALMCFMFHGGMYWFVINGIYESGNNYLLIILLVVVSASFLYYTYKFFIPVLKGNIAIELTRHGIIDNINSREFCWDDIVNIDRIDRARSGGIIVISVKDPQKYLPTNFGGYIPYYLGILFRGYPITIGTNWLSVTSVALFNEMCIYTEQRRSANEITR